ncbi:hypothetical protein H5410_021091 [Solanum commersonii]|uniref:Uncharacterized protein n=1 Tax=Solanum commersonii TaxID=4109 RepID=A0A9J5ZAZ6_SOLCO|nr:hypothetical protein H5410_021091 [Solanum commersonii]
MKVLKLWYDEVFNVLDKLVSSDSQLFAKMENEMCDSKQNIVCLDSHLKLIQLIDFEDEDDSDRSTTAEALFKNEVPPPWILISVVLKAKMLLDWKLSPDYAYEKLAQSTS